MITSIRIILFFRHSQMNSLTQPCIFLLFLSSCYFHVFSLFLFSYLRLSYKNFVIVLVVVIITSIVAVPVLHDEYYKRESYQHRNKYTVQNDIDQEPNKWSWFSAPGKPLKLFQAELNYLIREFDLSKTKAVLLWWSRLIIIDDAERIIIVSIIVFTEI